MDLAYSSERFAWTLSYLKYHISVKDGSTAGSGQLPWPRVGKYECALFVHCNLLSGYTSFAELQ